MSGLSGLNSVDCKKNNSATKQGILGPLWFSILFKWSFIMSSFINNSQMMSFSCCALSNWELFIWRLVFFHHIKDLLCAYFFGWTLSSIVCSIHVWSKPCCIVVLFIFSIVFVTEPFCGLIEPNNTICSIKLLFWSKLPQRGKLVPKQNM